MRHAVNALVLSACLTSPAFAQDGGKLAWMGKNGDPRDSVTLAKSEGRAMLLFFSSEKSQPSIEASVNQFSDPKVVEASKEIYCIFVECAWGTKNQGLMAQYKVTAYPTILLCDPDGNLIKNINSRNAESIAADLLAAGEKYRKGAAKDDATAPVPKPKGLGIADATQEAKRLSRPLAIYFFDDSPGTISVNAALNDELLKETRRRFAFAAVEYRKGSDDCTKYDVTRAPTIVVLDVTLPKPEEKPLAKIAGSRSARELKRELEAALAGLAAEGVPGTKPSKEEPSAKKPAETLSDDEIERKFIQARVAVALDLQKKGKKDKAIEMLEDIIKSFPKHVDTPAVQKLLDEARK